MKRFIDNFNKDAYKDDICVICPKCKGLGLIKNNKFKCTSCFCSQTHDIQKYRYQANAICNNCNRYIRTDIKKELANYPVLNIICPHCNMKQTAKTRKVALNCWGYSNIIIINSTASVLGYPLYFQSSFNNKPVFAKNRKHLQHLIDYIEADLRVGQGIMQYLPSFMKYAKNRKGLLKILKRLQEGKICIY